MLGGLSYRALGGRGARELRFLVFFRRDLARDLGLLADIGCTRSHLALWTHSDLWEAVGKEIARSINSWTDQIDSKEGREQELMKGA